EAYKQADNQQQEIQAGIGLGLYLVRKLVASLNGSLELISSPNEGSRFTIRIPVMESTAVENWDNEDGLTRLGATILVVDDDVLNLELLKVVLEMSFTKVLLTESAENALNLLKDEKIDILLTDRRLPGISGPELVVLATKSYGVKSCVLMTAAIS